MACNLTVCHELDSNTFANCTCNQVSQFGVSAVVIFQQLRHKGPRTRRSKRARARTRIKVVQVLFRKTHVTNHVLVDSVGNSPVLPGLVIYTHFQVNETVSQRSRHTISNTFVAFTVTSGNHNHVLRQNILTDTTVQDQLIRTCLNAWCGTVHFVQEQNDNGMLACKFFVGQIDRRSPIHLFVVLVEERNTTQVSGFHLRQTQVNERTAKFAGNTFHNFGLTNTRRAPQEYGTLLLKAFQNCTFCTFAGNCAVFGHGLFTHIKSPLG